MKIKRRKQKKYVETLWPNTMAKQYNESQVGYLPLPQKWIIVNYNSPKYFDYRKVYKNNKAFEQHT